MKDDRRAVRDNGKSRPLVTFGLRPYQGATGASPLMVVRCMTRRCFVSISVR
jgi:hypothetical protein